MPRCIFEKSQTEAKRLLLPKYSNRWVWDICMGDSRRFAVAMELAKYGQFSTQKWLVILYVLPKGRGEAVDRKRKGISFI